MIDNEKIQSLFKEITELNFIEVNMLLIDLIKSGKIDFVELAKMYVQILQQSNKNKTASINTLGLMLGVYCMTDTSQCGKAARQHLYESGMYGHGDGSKFGQMLDEEFKKIVNHKN